MRQASPIKRTVVKSAAPKNRLETPLAQTSYSKEEFNRKVQEQAYHLYVKRGCVNGYDVEDWLAAEQIVKGQ
jgi:hypothetical protein